MAGREKDVIPRITLNQAQELAKKKEAVFVDARKSAFL